MIIKVEFEKGDAINLPSSLEGKIIFVRSSINTKIVSVPQIVVSETKKTVNSNSLRLTKTETGEHTISEPKAIDGTFYRFSHRKTSIIFVADTLEEAAAIYNASEAHFKRVYDHNKASSDQFWSEADALVNAPATPAAV